jgi:hypothetical protein
MRHSIGRRALSGLLLGMALSVCACGGSDSSDSSRTTDPAFVGRWLGTWSSTGSFGNQAGSADLTIGVDGKIAGTLHNDATGADGTMSGYVDPAGRVSGVYAYGSLQYSSSGQMLIQSNGHLGGAIDTYDGTTKAATSTFDLVKQ